VTRYDLDGKVAIVTGASGGLGEQFARGLAESGASVVLAARRATLLEEIADDIRTRHGVEALVVETDVSKESDIVALVARTVSELGTVDSSSTTPACTS
jgi:short-subunit dehydrogenase